MRKRWFLYSAYVLLLTGVLAAAIWGSREVMAWAENQPVGQGTCIVIDAGHGGEDGGASSPGGRLESTYNLEISLRLNDLFHLLGYDTRMIRTTDTAVYTKGETIAQKKASDLKERVRIVNETENALLLSIHQNNFPDGRYSGAQVFYAGTDGSEYLAKLLQEKLVTTLNPGSNRKAKKCGGVYLMAHIDCTGVLIECGFLSNAQEEAMLRSGDYQKKLCCVIATVAGQYLSNP